MTIAPAPILPRRIRARDRLASALVVADPLDRASNPLADAMATGLAERGLAAAALRAETAPVGAHGIDAALEAGRMGIATLRATPQVDGARLGIVGIGLGAALASLLCVEEGLRRVAFVSPVSVELLVRRLDRPGQAESTVDESALRRLAQLEPLRRLAEAPPRPTLVLHGAAEERVARDHAISIATALQLDGRRVERRAVAFAGRHDDSPPLREALLARLRDFLAAE